MAAYSILALYSFTVILFLFNGSYAQSSEQVDFIQAMEELTVGQTAQRELQQRLLRAARRRLDDSSSSSYNSNYGLDLSQYALKYIGCTNIHTWNDNAAADSSSNSPLIMHRFVQFRFCESNSCSSFNKYGCSSHYGEYILPMEDYLYIMAEYHMKQLVSYCSICQKCLQLEQQATATDDTTTTATDDNWNGDDGNGAYNGYDDDRAAGQQVDDWAGYNAYWGEGGYYQNNNNYNKNNNKNNDDGGNNNNNKRGNDDYYADDVTDDYYNRRLGNNYYNNYNNYAQNNDDAAGDDGNANNNNGNTNNNYNSYSLADSYGNCKYKTVCNKYQSACKNFKFGNSGIENYFSCQQFNIGNNIGYVGPHCHSDGRTIGIGVYGDQYCNQYIGDKVDLSQYLSTDEAEFQLYYAKSCISCQASEAYSLMTDDQVTQGSSIYPLCSMLYGTSAKCEKHLSNNNYQSSSQQDDTDICNFVESMVESNWDEFGEPIILEDFDPSNWKSPSEYAKIVRKASPGQVFLLVSSILLCASLLLYSCYLHKKIVYRKPWIPPHRVNYPSAGASVMADYDAKSEAGRISRMSSGIVAMRTNMTEVSDDNSQTGGRTYATSRSRYPTSVFT